MSKKIYLISGLGADYRMFQNLDLSGFDCDYIEWIEPLEKETLVDYSLRLTQQIQVKNPILIGLSFGGLIAVEISKLIEAEKTILISSMKSKLDIPLYYRALGKLKIHKAFPFELVKKSNSLNNWLFGASATNEKLLLKETIVNTDLKFLKWAINSIITWSSESIPDNILQIHGNKDRLLPFSNVNGASVIKDGGHFMVLNKSGEVSKLIRNSLISVK